MEWFFEDEQKVKELQQELMSWLNTPYRHLTGIKGPAGGCDCIHMVVHTLNAVGANKGKHIHIPEYAPDWHMHRGIPLLYEGIKRQYDVEVSTTFTPSSMMDGDVILFHWGKQAAHAGIYLKGRIYQALTGIGVETRMITDSDFFNDMKYRIRIIK